MTHSRKTNGLNIISGPPCIFSSLFLYLYHLLIFLFLDILPLNLFTQFPIFLPLIPCYIFLFFSLHFTFVIDSPFLLLHLCTCQFLICSLLSLIRRIFSPWPPKFDVSSPIHPSFFCERLKCTLMSALNPSNMGTYYNTSIHTFMYVSREWLNMYSDVPRHATNIVYLYLK